jgi:hypothetical protein
MLAWLVVLALLAAPAHARTPPEVGIGENGDAVFADPLFSSLGVRHVRVVVSYDVVARGGEELARVDRYLAAAHAAGAEPLVTFEHARGDAHECPADLPQCRLPTPAEYARSFGAFRERFPAVRAYGPWNEPNHATQPTWRKPEAAARFANIAARMCRDCTIVAGDVLDQADRRLARRPSYRATTRWVARYRAALRIPRRVCGIHNYSDVNRFRTAGTRALMRALRCRSYWLTETGGILESRGLKREPRRQLRATRFLFKLVDREPRISRVYVYTWFGRVTAGWDSGLVGRRRDGRSAARPPYEVVAERVRTGTPVPTTIGRESDALARGALRAWAERQTPEGAFPNPAPAEIAAGHGGFAPPMLAYALQRAGWTASAARAWPSLVQPPRATAFDVIGAAYALRDFGAPLAAYLRAYSPPPAGAYNNLALVEAVAALAMRSPPPQAAGRVINETVPRLAAPLLRAGTVTGAFLSDPRSHPLA